MRFWLPLLMLPALAWADPCESPTTVVGNGSVPFIQHAAPAPGVAGGGSSGGGVGGLNLADFLPSAGLPAGVAGISLAGAAPAPSGLGDIEPGGGDECEPPPPPPALSCGSMVASKQCGGTTLSSTIVLLNANACRDWCASTNLAGGTCCGFVLLGTTCKLTNGSVGGNILPVNMAASCSYQ